MVKNTVSYHYRTLSIANIVPIHAYAAFQVWHFIFNIQSRKVSSKFIEGSAHD